MKQPAGRDKPSACQQMKPRRRKASGSPDVEIKSRCLPTKKITPDLNRPQHVYTLMPRTGMSKNFNAIAFNKNTKTYTPMAGPQHCCNCTRSEIRGTIFTNLPTRGGASGKRSSESMQFKA